MIFCIFTAGEEQTAARMCAATVRHHHPKATILHLTDETTPAGEWADRALRRPWDGTPATMMYLRMGLLADLRVSEETVYLDSDVLLCAPVDPVFAEPFEIALTIRTGHGDMPYNDGVMFARSNKFWRAVVERMEAEPRYKAFLACQVAVAEEAATGRHDLLVLQCDDWNCSDMKRGKPKRAKVMHYKGDRKVWMKRDFDEGIWK